MSSNRLSTLPSGFLHLKNLKKLNASKNYMEKLFDEESSTYSPVLYLTFQDLICLGEPQTVIKMTFKTVLARDPLHLSILWAKHV